MYYRFVDNKEIIKDKYDFVKREHGIHGLWLGLAFSACFVLILLSYFLVPVSSFSIAIIFLVMSLLFTLTIAVISKDKDTISTLEFQNALFAGATKKATELCIIMRHDGRVVYVDPDYNKAFHSYIKKGLSEIEALCKLGDLNEKEKSKLINALSEGKNETIEFTFIESEGNARPLSLSLSPIGISSEKKSERTVNLAVNPINRPSGYFILRIDKRNDEEKCREYFRYPTTGSDDDLNKNARNFYDCFDMAFFSIDKKGEIISANDSFCKQTGYSLKDINANKIGILDLTHDTRIKKIISSPDESYNGEMQLSKKDESIVPVIISKVIARDNKENIIGAHYTMVKLHHSHTDGYIFSEADTDENSADLLSSSPIATAIIDAKGFILQNNDEFRHLTNRQDNEDTTWNLMDVIREDNAKEILEAINNATNEIIRIQKPIDIKIKGEKAVTASLYISKIKSESQSPVHLIVQLIDTTEFKNLELKFVHSQKMQAVGQLAGGIAHDFNNLLTAMMGFCDLLLMRHPAGDPSFADIMQIKQNANRAANLVRQLLAFSRKQTLQPKVINITDVLADLSNLIGRLIGENIELKMSHGRDLGNIKVDQGQLEQVIINLAVNARDAMTKGGSLTIQTKNITIDKNTKLDKELIPPTEDDVIEEGEYVLVEVEDTGTGIDRKVIDKIFEPFFSTKEIGSGTGLGLSTVYGIIKQTDGYIYVSSKIGKGTKFSIFLKRYSSELTSEDKMPETASLAEPHDLSGSGTILLVEDETPVRIFSKSALTNKGYSVLEAECAEDALKIVKEKGNKIDIIITDVVMPGMTGPAMIEEVGKQYPDIKVVFISGYAEDAFIETYGIERKFNFLSKPYSLKQLATKVKEVLESEKEVR